MRPSPKSSPDERSPAPRPVQLSKHLRSSSAAGHRFEGCALICQGFSKFWAFFRSHRWEVCGVWTCILGFRAGLFCVGLTVEDHLNGVQGLALFRVGYQMGLGIGSQRAFREIN